VTTKRPKEEDLTPGCACAACGHEQSSMSRCTKCGSVRVVLTTVLRDLFGEGWRNAFTQGAPAPTKVP